VSLGVGVPRDLCLAQGPRLQSVIRALASILLPSSLCSKEPHKSSQLDGTTPQPFTVRTQPALPARRALVCHHIELSSRVHLTPVLTLVMSLRPALCLAAPARNARALLLLRQPLPPVCRKPSIVPP